jgi:hypothetical protein
MPGVERSTSAGPGEVWSVLSDGWLYASWVVGAARIRAVDTCSPPRRVPETSGIARRKRIRHPGLVGSKNNTR